jgi:hypothetical protein
MLGIDRQNAVSGRHEPGENPGIFRDCRRGGCEGPNKEDLYEWVNQARRQLDYAERPRAGEHRR